MARINQLNTPFEYERFLLVKTKWENPPDTFSFISANSSGFDKHYVMLNIFDNGWTHETTSVFILDAHNASRSVEMFKSSNADKNTNGQ